jgi:hypothetical protein
MNRGGGDDYDHRSCGHEDEQKQSVNDQFNQFTHRLHLSARLRFNSGLDGAHHLGAE